jgi:exosortase K
MTKNISYYAVAFMLFVILKFVYSQANNDMLLFILQPISELISIITNNDAVYTTSSGFFYQGLNITIDKSCSGINFWLISFMTCLLSIIPKKRTRLQKIIAFPTACILAYVLTLFANTSRILISIFITKNTSLNYSWLHEAQGVFIYLTFLILFYLLINHLLSKTNSRHAKLA